MTDHLTREDVEKLREGTTPGPWEHIDPPDPNADEVQVWVKRSDRYRVIHEHDLGFRDDIDAEIRANARLIAAAPSLAATALALMDENTALKETDEERLRTLTYMGLVLEQSAALKAEVERLRGLAFTAYCEGYIAAGGAWQDDNGWAQSESYAALQEDRT